MSTNESTLKVLRGNFNSLHASNQFATTAIAAQFKKDVLAQAGNTYYEQIGTVSYNPDLKRLEAVLTVKRDNGYNGNLCSDGSFAYVRFYLDYGRGWEDQGYSAVNEHDIPTGLDCTKLPEKPLAYSASLQIVPKTNKCNVHVLPKARAVLEWNKIPPANTPNYSSIWGNTVDDFIQIKPARELMLTNAVFSEVISLALAHPNLKIADAAKLVDDGENALKTASINLNLPLQVIDLVELYREKKEVTAGRYTLQHVLPVLNSYDPQLAFKSVEALSKVKLDISAIVSELEKTSANVSYEQLESVGLDYNLEQFVASFRVKRPVGYSGDLCTHGSLEYVSFWADWDNTCKWDYVGTTTVNVHDINDIPKQGLSYAAVLPYDFSKLRKSCSTPGVVKVRAVLSWGVAPSTNDAEKLGYWGNRLDAYIQVKPGVSTGTLKPIFNILGGIPVDKISNVDGLTIPGAKFALNQAPVNDNSPFGGVVVLQGPSFVGQKYRVKVTNMNTLASYYVGNDFVIVGWLMVPPYVQYTTVQADPTTFYYDYQTFDKNTDNVLARWSPGTNDLLKVELEIAGVPGVFTKFIQMDNNSPVISLTVNDTGNCSFYKVGDTITGSYSVYDQHLLSYSLVSSFGGSVDGFANTSDIFSFATGSTTSPCGKISLVAYEKTIYNSQSTNNGSYVEHIVCLQPAAINTVPPIAIKKP